MYLPEYRYLIAGITKLDDHVCVLVKEKDLDQALQDNQQYLIEYYVIDRQDPTKTRGYQEAAA